MLVHLSNFSLQLLITQLKQLQQHLFRKIAQITTNAHLNLELHQSKAAIEPKQTQIALLPTERESKCFRQM